MMRLLWISILVVCGLPLSLAGQENSDTSHCPCCTPAHRQFDFWLGDWVAYDLQKEEEKVVAGTNRIVLLQDSCLLRENWLSQNGKFTGTSYNWYDRQTEKWHQSWIDNQGGSLLLSGGLRDGKMVLLSEEMKSQNGEPYINRLTWSPKDEGSVRQHWEISKDEGKTWQTVFDGLYVKKEKGKN